jgi:hypothetical protein
MFVMGSPVFHIMFCGGFSEADPTSANNNTVPIPDIKPSVFKDLKELRRIFSSIISSNCLNKLFFIF